jgi:type 1 glutamine amidotransferase
MVEGFSMSGTGKNMLLLLGGIYHDFEGFREFVVPYFQQQGYTVRVTYDFDALTEPTLSEVDVVLLNTCLGGPRKTGPWAADLNAAQTAALVTWVQAGGGLLGLHAASVIGEESQRLRRLLGGYFIEHPPEAEFTVVPLYREHPITQGVEAFVVQDELFINAYERDIEIHMVAQHRRVCHPLVWTRHEGAGRVAYIGLGHSEKVWALPAYRKLTAQALMWLNAPRN